MERIKALPTDDTLSLVEVQKLTAWATSTFFNHHQLYQHVFTQEREGERRRRDLFVHTAITPPPLSEGTLVVPAPAAAPGQEAGAPGSEAAPGEAADVERPLSRP